MDELVKALRFCETHATCRECVFCPKDAEDMRCSNVLTNAADAIEQLSADLERLKDYESFWKEEYEAFDVTMAHYADYSNIWTTDSGAAYNADLSKCDKTRYEYVTHWQPLPEPPKEE